MKHISEYVENYIDNLERALSKVGVAVSNRDDKKETDQERTARLKAEAQRLIDEH